MGQVGLSPEFQFNLESGPFG